VAATVVVPDMMVAAAVQKGTAAPTLNKKRIAALATV